MGVGTRGTRVLGARQATPTDLSTCLCPQRGPPASPATPVGVTHTGGCEIAQREAACTRGARRTAGPACMRARRPPARTHYEPICACAHKGTYALEDAAMVVKVAAARPASSSSGRAGHGAGADDDAARGGCCSKGGLLHGRGCGSSFTLLGQESHYQPAVFLLAHAGAREAV